MLLKYSKGNFKDCFNSYGYSAFAHSLSCIGTNKTQKRFSIILSEVRYCVLERHFIPIVLVKPRKLSKMTETLLTGTLSLTELTNKSIIFER